MFIIVIFYFENVAFFHAKLGSDVCTTFEPLVTLNSGDINVTRYSITSKKIAISQLSSTSIGASFWWWDALLHEPVRIREETFESGNLLSGIVVSKQIMMMMMMLHQNFLHKYNYSPLTKTNDCC